MKHLPDRKAPTAEYWSAPSTGNYFDLYPPARAYSLSIVGDARVLTKDEQATNFETMLHIQKVQHFINRIIHDLMRRGEEHDHSKLAHPEVALFTEFTPRLAASTYGSEEYENFRKSLGPALAHHYAHNRHHPEHFKHGIEDMNLVDLIEMFCDWKAATLRHNDGNIRKSIEKNAERFHISPQLIRILENTADLFE